MSIGIPRAVDVNDEEFDRWAVAQDLPPFARPLRCHGCGTRVDPVNGYVTRDGTQVEPLYRLAKGGRHAEGCIYDFDAQARLLAERNVGVVERDGDTYVLILDVVGDDPSPTEPEGTPRGRIKYLRNQEARLEQTLRAAHEIARLLRHFEDDSEAQSRFRARYEGRIIAWSNFCFDAGRDLKRLHRELNRTDPAHDHPRAVVGRVERVGDSQNGGSKVAYLAIRDDESTTRRPLHASDGVRIVPVLRTSQAGVLERHRGQMVVSYGRWTTFTPASKGTHYVTLWLDEFRGALAPLKDRTIG